MRWPQPADFPAKLATTLRHRLAVPPPQPIVRVAHPAKLCTFDSDSSAHSFAATFVRLPQHIRRLRPRPLPLPLRRHLAAGNVRSGRIFAWIFAPFIALLTLFETAWGTQTFGMGFLFRNADLMVLRLVTVVFSVAFLLELHRLNQRQPGVIDSPGHERATLWHGALIPILCAAIAVQQHLRLGDLTVYFLGLIFVTSIYVFPPRWFIPMLIAGLVILIGGIHSVGNVTPVVPQNNVYVATLGAAAIGAIRFSLHRRRFLQDAALEDQRSNLAALNQALEHERNRLRDLVERQNEVVAVLAHDLKQPLHATSGVAQWLTETAANPKLTEEVLRREVCEAAADLRQVAASSVLLIEKLLDAHRLDDQGVALQVGLVCLDDVVDRVAPLHAGIARRKRIRLELDVPPPGAIPPVRGDAEKLAVVVDNLLSNAVKYTPAEGTVTVRLLATNGASCLEVSDTGQGLLPEEVPLLFRRFQRLSAKPTGGESSTGLGLAIVKRIVDLHGGRVDASSGGRHRGTTFAVHLPSVQNTEDEAELA